MSRHHPDLVMCRKQSGIAIGRLCDKCDGKCPVCDSYVRPTTLVRICDECSFGNYQNKCVVCGGEGISDAFYCFECTRLEKDRDGCPKIINLGSSRTDLFCEYSPSAERVCVCVRVCVWRGGLMRLCHRSKKEFSESLSWVGFSGFGDIKPPATHPLHPHPYPIRRQTFCTIGGLGFVSLLHFGSAFMMRYMYLIARCLSSLYRAIAHIHDRSTQFDRSNQPFPLYKK